MALIVEPYAKLIVSDSQNALQYIEAAARISHASEDKQTDTSAEKFLRAVVLDHGDWSVIEHVTVSVEFFVDRGITHEIVRHRLFSFTQSSTRFINYATKMPPQFIYPKPGTVINQAWLAAIQSAEDYYRILLEQGWRPQEARSVFPNALASKLLMTGNLRNWRHFLLMRTSKEAHPQMRQVTIPLLQQFKNHFPVLFEDIAPEARQAVNVAKGR